jgi:hypothetical protein
MWCDYSANVFPVASALVSRYIPVTIFPYYIALASQLLASIYAYFFIPETLPQHTSSGTQTHSPALSTASLHDETYQEELLHTIEEQVVAPIKPLGLLLPKKDKEGNVNWRLGLLTISLLTTTCGVSGFLEKMAVLMCLNGLRRFSWRRRVYYF